MPSQPLVSATELASRLGDPDTVVVDCRVSLLAPGAGREAYLAGHIPTARYAHLLDDPLRRATEAASAVITGKPSAKVVSLK